MHKLLPSTIVDYLRACNKIRVLTGDITLEDFGLDKDTLQDLRSKISIYIHSASSINLKAGPRQMTPIVVDPSVAAAKMALSFALLERFVFVSTAYANGHLHWLHPENGNILDCEVEERIYPLRAVVSKNDSHAELKNIKEFGTTPEYSCIPHLYGYSYAKHLTERLLSSIFETAGRKEQLLIFRPSCIGPAEQEPFPHFEAAGSIPLTTAICAIITTSPGKALCPSNLADPEKATADEIPVDIVVNRMVMHLAMGTAGCVHAVAGVTHRRSSRKICDAMANNRSWWWGRPALTYCATDTPEAQIWPAARFYKIWGCSYLFHQEKTERIWDVMDPLLQQQFPLFTRRDPTDVSDFEIRGRNARKMLISWLGKKYGRVGRWVAALICPWSYSSIMMLDPVVLVVNGPSKVSLNSCIEVKSAI